MIEMIRMMPENLPVTWRREREMAGVSDLGVDGKRKLPVNRHRFVVVVLIRFP
ncbi:hypothetical protein Hanom_Chr09g00822851 [Helianthus anomalus]